MRPMSFTVRVLIGLILGLAIGMAVAGTSTPWLQKLPGIVEPISALFINAIRMTVIPLVVSSLIVGVASARDARAVGHIGGRALLWFFIALFASVVFSAVLAFPLLRHLDIDPAIAAALRADAASAGKAAAETASKLPSASQWIVDLVPVNAFKALVDGSMLPLIFFSLAFGLSLTKVEAGRQQTVVRFFHGISDAMLILVQWVLRFAPYGVFALAVPLGARMGMQAAGALIYYIILLSLIAGAFIVFVLYPSAVLLGRVPLRKFLRASAPSFAVAFSSRSSLAALPATIEGAKTELGLPSEIHGFVLSLAASMFRVGGAIAEVVAAAFIARLYGVDLLLPQIVTIVVTVVFTSLTIPGIPAGAIIVMAPVLSAAGVPVEGIGVLMAVDTIPDMFRTSANVVGWLTIATILGRRIEPMPILSDDLKR
jgi:proton glutamate symport protein